MTQQLSPCPFCGFATLTINPIARIKAGGEEWRAWVQCGTCNAAGPSVSSDKSGEEARLLAGTLWNRRKEEGRLWIEVVKLKAKVSEFQLELDTSNEVIDEFVFGEPGDFEE